MVIRTLILKQVLTVTNSDSIYINELRFNAVASSMYSGKLMFDKFGKWDKEISLTRTSKPILIWKNKKLLESKKNFFQFIPMELKVSMKFIHQ